MPVNFKITITEEYMYDFLLKHHYSHMSGIIATIAGIGSAIVALLLIVQLRFDEAGIWVMTAFIFLYINRQALKNKAKLQVKKSEMINKTLHCELAEEGVIISREGERATNPWENFTKVITTKKSVVLYMGRVRAFIFPKEQMGDQYQAAVAMIRKHIPAKKIRGLR